MNFWRWSNRFSSEIPAEAQISLGEGNTPLIHLRRIGAREDMPFLFAKLEGGNPTGSYKDRFAAAAVSHMLASGQHTCIATSSGNTGAALAAYCAAAEIRCRIAVVEGAPAGKLKQMQAYGADIARVRQFGADAQATALVIGLLGQIGQRAGYALQVSAFVHSPVGMSGVQTISYELAVQSEAPIDHVFCPAGGGGLCVAVARGFQELGASGELRSLPTVECVQPEGNDTIASALRDGLDQARAVTCTSHISGLQVASVIDGDLTIGACRATGGSGHLVSDEAVWTLQKRLAREEGIFCEPAGAVALAGALQAVRDGRIRRDAVTVCLVTGTGFKDDAAIDRINSDAQCPLIDPDDLDLW